MKRTNKQNRDQTQIKQKKTRAWTQSGHVYDCVLIQFVELFVCGWTTKIVDNNNDDDDRHHSH